MGGFSNVTGDPYGTVMNADNVCFDGTARTTLVTTNGQLLIGSTIAPHIRIGTLTAGTGISITNGNGAITIGLSGGGAAVEHLTGNTGGQLNPDGSNNFNVLIANATIGFAGAGSTLTLDFSNHNLLLGSTGSAITTADANVSLGQLAAIALTSGSSNVAVGEAALQHGTQVIGNVAIGANSLNTATAAQLNVCVGVETMQFATTSAAANNVALGYQALQNILTGAQNICIGTTTGQQYTGAETNNICIGHNLQGTTGDSNKIRIGNASHTQCFITGIDGVNVGSTAKVVTEGSNQLGTATITAGSGISVTPGANTITIATTVSAISWSVVTIDASFTVNTGTIANKAGLLTMTLPATAAIGDIIEITGINTALGWKIAQNANQQIFFGTSSTTLGVGGSLASTAIRDSLKMVCVVAGASTVWNVLSSVGNITVV